MLEHYGPHQGVRIARKHLGWYIDEAVSRGDVPMPGAVRQALMTSNQPSEVLRLVTNWFSTSKWSDVSICEPRGSRAASSEIKEL